MNELTSVTSLTNVTDMANGLSESQSMGVMIAAIAIGIVISFLGLKLVKVLSVILGFFVGAGIGITVAQRVGVEGVAFGAIIVVCGIIVAALSFILYRFGIFCVTFLYSATVVYSLLGGASQTNLLIALGVAMLLAVLAVIFLEPIIIIITGLSGGLSAGYQIVRLSGIAAPVWMGYAIGLVIGIVGMIVQFILHSRKIGKKEVVKSKKIKEAASMESEVEKARSVLDDSDLDDDLDDDVEDTVEDVTEDTVEDIEEDIKFEEVELDEE